MSEATADVSQGVEFSTDAWLMGKPSRLPRPVNPTDRPLMA